jgi:hypothetical protein
MDEVIGFLLGTKNKAGWFTTKEYVDLVAIEGLATEVMSARFSITDGELYAEDITQELVAEKFAVADGYLTFSTTV